MLINPYFFALRRIQIELAELHYQVAGEVGHLVLLEAERVVAGRRSDADRLVAGRELLSPGLHDGQDDMEISDAVDRVQAAVEEATALARLLLAGLSSPAGPADEAAEETPDVRGTVKPEAVDGLVRAAQQLQQVSLELAAEVGDVDE